LERHITDDIDKLNEVLPRHLRDAVEAMGRTEDLLEIVLDLGRVPTARFVDGEVVLYHSEVTRDDIDWIVENIGAFDADNRAGMERTLHRISAIRNRQGTVIGLTCRVGRAVYGTIDIINDLINSGRSVLILGPPGVGKTTLLREAARVLAETKRVVIVDTSNEIGGDGDVPHPAVGRSRRMQVSVPTLQHEVMIEAVENHNPQVIVIDEIGREQEALAARTIAERGVQLIGTAHGNALDNLLLNPTLSDLVGGIESVTLSDDEARRRGTQKTVLERRSPPTFDVLVEIQTRDRLVVHDDIAESIDSLLRGSPRDAELRERDDNGEIFVTSIQPESTVITERQMGREAARQAGRVQSRGSNGKSHPVTQGAGGFSDTHPNFDPNTLAPLNVYAYGVARNRLQQSAKRLHVPLTVVEDFDKANAIVTVKSYYRKRPRLITDAEQRGMPIYVLRANTVSQTENFLSDLFDLDTQHDDSDPFGTAMRETEAAIMQVRAGADGVDLTPQSRQIRRQQHEMIKQADLDSESRGKEPRRYVRVIHPE
jgi:stage III sporulation protein SpoIIIAA